MICKNLLLLLITMTKLCAQESPSFYDFPALPDSFTFCGERLPLESEEIRERMEEIFYTRTGTNDRLPLLLRRTGRYFPLFEKLLKETGMPNDLKYLSVAESSLKLEAYSSADAAGLWQFIPATARLWGLRVDKQIDERFHVEKSTRASLSLLSKLKKEFGSWALAAAAYNFGEGNIHKAIKEQQDSNYYNLFLNKETRNYVLHIVALKEIIEHPEKYQSRLREADYYRPYNDRTTPFSIQGPVPDIGDWAKKNGTNYKTLKLLNYWISKNSLPEGRWELLLPNTLIMTDSAATKTTKVFYNIKPGDNLTRIALDYGVTVDALRIWNNLNGEILKVGDRLLIYQ